MGFDSYVCSDCGHEVVSSTKPLPIKWTDGHVCKYWNLVGPVNVPVSANSVLEDACRNRMGWLTKEDVQVLASDMELRLQWCLVRCGGCRFTCPAQDVEHLVHCVEAGGDYVRDVCIPAGDPIWKKLGIKV